MLILDVTVNLCAFPFLPAPTNIQFMIYLYSFDKSVACSRASQNVTKSSIPNPKQAPGELTFHSVGGPSMSLALVPQYCRARWRHSVPNSKSDSLHCRGDTRESRCCGRSLTPVYFHQTQRNEGTCRCSTTVYALLHIKYVLTNRFVQKFENVLFCNPPFTTIWVEQQDDYSYLKSQ